MVTLKYGEEVPAKESTKTGYTFSGWDNIPATMPDSDITIKGSYKFNQTTPVSSLTEAPSIKVWSFNHTIYIETAPDSQYKIISR